MTNSFYTVLTSDASLKQFHKKKAVEFKMQWPGQMQLSEDWKVTMTGIIYPYTWVNVRDNKFSYALICKKGLAP